MSTYKSHATLERPSCDRKRSNRYDVFYHSRVRANERENERTNEQASQPARLPASKQASKRSGYTHWATSPLIVYGVSSLCTPYRANSRLPIVNCMRSNKADRSRRLDVLDPQTRPSPPPIFDHSTTPMTRYECTIQSAESRQQFVVDVD